MRVKLISELDSLELKQLEEVYYQTTTSDKDEIKYKYFDYYIENSPSLFFVAVDKEVLGYVCGLEDTLSHYEQLEMHSYLDHFRDELEVYPSHLHINVHPKAQGQGVGKLLIKHFEDSLTSRGASGVHIITLAGEENNSFYTSQGYIFHKIRNFFDKELLLMGKLLIS